MKTKQVNCGGVLIGGGAPISIQSMTNKKEAGEIIDQILDLKREGCDIVRVSIPDEQAALNLTKIKDKTDIPIVADIHFDYKLAIKAIENGADKIRINPGNIGGKENLKAVAEHAKKANIPIRVGVNAGSLEKDIILEFGHTADALAESALRNVRYLEEVGFNDIVVSMKASNVKLTYDSHKILRPKIDYPFHIGITEAGTINSAIIKSSMGIGSLLLEGIGDTMRVSITGDPVKEVQVAKEILRTLELRKGGFEVISCPTCARCNVDLERVTSEVETAIKSLQEPDEKITIAVMGCAVNGPGEAKSADIGVACGAGEGVLFKHGAIVKKVHENNIVEELLRLMTK